MTIACCVTHWVVFCLQAAPQEAGPPILVYLGPAVGQARLVMLAGLELTPPEWLKDNLSALAIARKGAEQPRSLAQRLLDDAHHALLATPDAARRRGLAAPSATAEAAALQALAAAARVGGASGKISNTLRLQMDDGTLQLILAPTAFALASRVQLVLGRPLVPPASSSGVNAAPEVAGQASSEARQGLSAEMQEGIEGFLLTMLQHAAAMEGRQLSQLPAQARADLTEQLVQLISRRLHSGQTFTALARPGVERVPLQVTQEDFEQLRASIRALRLPPAPGVPRCAACGAAEDPPLRKLRCCAACRRVGLVYAVCVVLWSSAHICPLVLSAARPTSPGDINLCSVYRHLPQPLTSSCPLFPPSQAGDVLQHGLPALRLGPAQGGVPGCTGRGWRQHIATWPPSDWWSAGSSDPCSSKKLFCSHCHLMLAKLAQHALHFEHHKTAATSCMHWPLHLAADATHASTVLPCACYCCLCFCNIRISVGPELEHKSTGSKQRQKVSSVGQSEGRPQHARRGGGEADFRSRGGRWGRTAAEGNLGGQSIFVSFCV